MLATAAAIRCTVLAPQTAANPSAPHPVERAGADPETSGDGIAAAWPIATATAVTAVDR